MTKICFVSYEIAPTTKGGAGALIANAIHILTQAGHEVSLLLDIPVHEYVQFEWHDRLFFPNAHLIRAYRVEELCTNLRLPREAFLTEHLWRSYRFEHALNQLVAIESPDLIEFFDYCGASFYTLMRKITQGRYAENEVVIRFHTTIEPIHKEKSVASGTDSFVIYRLEHQTFQLAERILFPSQEIYRWANSFYRIKGQTGISPPPLKRLSLFNKSNPPERNLIIFMGYMDYMKGADTFLSAALMLLQKSLDANYKFVLVGGETGGAPEGYASFTDYLKARIPPKLQHHFEFTGQISHQQLSNMLPNVAFAVVPSHLESFGYAAHELYAVGIPLIVRNIPVFTQYFHHEQNALVFDGTAEDLAHQMERLWRDESLRQKLSKPYEVLPAPLGEAYEQQHTNSWMAVSQPENNLSLQILVLSEKGFAPINLPDDMDCTIWRLSPRPSDGHAPFPFLGKLWWVYDHESRSVPLSQWRSRDLMLLLVENDVVEEEYLRQSARILSQYPQISFVSCWREVNGKIQTFPVDAATEVLPFLGDYIPSRIVFRTKPGTHFFDLFDSRAGAFSEIHYLWKLEDEGGVGVSIPEVYLRLTPGTYLPTLSLDSAGFNFAFMNTTVKRQAKIADYLIATKSKFLGDLEQFQQERSHLKLAEMDLKLLLAKLSQPPWGYLFRTRKNFRILQQRYLSRGE